MKRIITCLVFAAAFTASAASINWQVSGLANKILNNYDGSVAANTPVYLILADTASLASITGCADKDTFVSALEDITVASGTTKADGKKWDGAGNYTAYKSPLLTAGAQHALAMLYYSEDAATGIGYYKITTGKGNAYDETVPGATGSISLSYANLGTATWTKGYEAVPEPSTAALALAGLALLLKRRKA